MRFVLVLLACLLAGCAHQPESPLAQQARIERLSAALQGLSPAVTASEADGFARVAVERAAGLREDYGVRLTPWMHNVEVNSGTRSRGLCFHYARDLAAALEPLPAPHLQIHRIQANRNGLTEHNALAITARGAAWDSGLVLDAWRHAGVLYFGPVRGDRYPWQPRKKSSP